MSIRKWFARKPSTSPVRVGSPVSHTEFGVGPEDLLTHTDDDSTNDSEFEISPPTPVNQGRLVSHLSELGYKFTTDEDGDVVGIWDGNFFWFMFMGTDSGFFQIRSRWHRNVGSTDKSLALQTCNDWNRDKLWPKTFVRDDTDSDGFAVYGENTFDFTEGATPKQFAYSIELALKSTLHFYQHLESLIAPESEESAQD